MANSNGTATRTVKSATDYPELLDAAEIRRDGLEVRVRRAEAHIRKLLGGHQNAEAIMQTILRPGDGLAVAAGKLALAERDVVRYQRLIARQAEDAPTVVSEMPTTPSDDK
jgi:hypothetical protein